MQAFVSWSSLFQLQFIVWGSAISLPLTMSRTFKRGDESFIPFCTEEGISQPWVQEDTLKQHFGGCSQLAFKKKKDCVLLARRKIQTDRSFYNQKQIGRLILERRNTSCNRLCCEIKVTDTSAECKEKGSVIPLAQKHKIWTRRSFGKTVAVVVKHPVNFVILSLLGSRMTTLP